MVKTMTLEQKIRVAVAIIVLIIGIFMLSGCIESENCQETAKVDHYKTTETEFYTITEPEYVWVCDA